MNDYPFESSLVAAVIENTIWPKNKSGYYRVATAPRSLVMGLILPIFFVIDCVAACVGEDEEPRK